MLNKLGLFVSLFLSIIYVKSQQIKGFVADQDGKPLLGASVIEAGTSNGAITDINGFFELKAVQENAILVISYSGFLSDTIHANFLGQDPIKLSENLKELDEVTVKASSTFIDNLEAKHLEVITEAELTKAACCNLSESFDTNASVDVSFSDAISGAKTISMLGLDGSYVQINRDNLPNIRGLAGRYGLSFIPGPWIQSIDVGKGSGTVVNGFESMTGQINVALKTPEQSERLYLNAYVNSLGRLEANANLSHQLSEKWFSGLLMHASILNSQIDQNDDSFLDLPMGRQINLLNQYKYVGERLRATIGFTMLRDEKVGGQVGFNFGDDAANSALYGFENTTSRAEIFGKLGVLFPNQPNKGFAFLYTASVIDIGTEFGRNTYTGLQKNVNGNLIYQNILGNSFHKYKTGVSFLYDDFNENYIDSAFSRQEVVPGVYYEYSFSRSEKFIFMLGARTDFHNLYGTYFSPRLHTKLQLTDEISFRMALGRGYRTPNALVENTNILVSSRRFIVEEDPLPEVSWNLGGSLTATISLSEKDLTLVTDYFYTTFENQLIYDLDASPRELRVYNLRGTSYAHSFQIEASYPISERLNAKAAYKYYDVKTTLDGRLQDVPFNARNRAFANLSYSTPYDKWEFDGTLHWFGSKRLPDTSGNETTFQRRSTTPHYFHINGQISRGFRWGHVYLGGENLTNFTQGDPIIDPENPFGNQFDASIVWAPIFGRMIYAGIRFKIE
ncbi:MAG: TonB-dependent receptor [Bacteroidota bacterium]